MGKLRIGPAAQDGEGDVDFAIHHMLPVRYGGKAVEDFAFANPPNINPEAASQPVNPGFSPVRHFSLASSFELMPVAPPLAGGPPKRPARRLSVRIEERPAPISAPVRPQEAVVDEPVPSYREAETPPLPAQPAAATPPVERARPRPAPLPDARAAPAPADTDEESIFESFDPLYALALYLAAALGTLFAISDLDARYTILWSVLILIGGPLTLMDSRRGRRGVGSQNMAWGIGYAVLIGGLLLGFVSQGLYTTSRLLFPESRYTLPALFQTLVLLGPIGETIFFRGMLQERRGIIASIVGAGIGTLLFYLPAGGDSAIGTVIAVALFLTALAGLYSYIRQRYGLAASYACQVTLNLMLFFIPRLIVAPRP